jgi:hypothetical protein
MPRKRRFPGRDRVGFQKPATPANGGESHPEIRAAGEMSMLRTIAAGALMVLAMAEGALAQQAAYAWTGMGQGSGKCTSYKMTVNVTVEGAAVKGVFQQEGRTERHFEATLGAGGVIKTKAKLDGGSSMDVKGTIKDGESRVVLDGYCKFDAKLIRK